MQLQPVSQSELQATQGHREPVSGFNELDPTELTRTEGGLGVAPMWDEKGNMVTCTDPRRFGGYMPPLTNVPPVGAAGVPHPY
jgi:hypothetical protein